MTAAAPDRMPEIEIAGTCVAGWEPLAEAFRRNFAAHGEIGASVAVYHLGEPVVDLWAGIADPAMSTAWAEDTVALVYSVTKGATSVLCHVLAAAGLLDLDAPVAELWPEFAAAGKSRVTTRMVLAHRAGLPALDDVVPFDELLDGAPVARRLAAQQPLWEPGTQHGYHALTFGWLLGEIVRRALGVDLGRAFAERVAGPLGLDLAIGLEPSQLGRVATLVNGPPPDPGAVERIPDPAMRELVVRVLTARADPTSLLARALSSNGVLPTPDAGTWNSPRVLVSQQPAAGAVTNARALARMYSACVVPTGGVRLLRPEVVQAAAVEQSAGPDRVLLTPSRFGTGFQLPRQSAPLLSPASFGHGGAGGALGFADREAALGFGYVQNMLSSNVGGDPRSASLIDALRRCL